MCRENGRTAGGRGWESQNRWEWRRGEAVPAHMYRENGRPAGGSRMGMAEQMGMAEPEWWQNKEWQTTEP
jgi:hypothetical protein